ncbi:hypothetical protein [Sanguibacter antarcticus]|uniref:Uncharacterized protein n=1 Tax=Sanguibacter antarcticus TaxID=372484 RepID=A0A2A9E877_9MICO|nr:hypothetical protein [Sanguibacter antarcticus]PFG35043.1 hypothetical protein ATL42_2976 [Sanguibacter antarcticus]
MTYGVDPSSGTDLTKQPPTSGQPGPEAYGQPGGPEAYGQPAPQVYGQPGPQAYGQPAPQAYGAQPPQQTGDIEVRPSSAQYRGFLTKTPIVFIVLVVFLYLRAGIAGLIITVVVGALSLGGVFFYLSCARVRMDALTVSIRGLVRTTTFARADLGAVVLTPYQVSASDGRVQLTLFALDRQGRRVLRLGSALWNPADLEGLAYAMGPVPVVYQEVLTPKLLTQRHPGSVSWVERHPFGFAGIIVLAVIAAVVLAAVVTVVLVP